MDDVRQEYPLEDLDPVQAAFAKRLLRWAEEVVAVFKDHRDGTAPFRIALLRSYLVGSAGSGKSKTLKTCVRHIRRLFQRENIDATVALTAYTGVAAFNMKFGAKIACLLFNISGRGQFQKELTGQRQRQCEETWKSVVLLIVDEISFIGKTFFA